MVWKGYKYVIADRYENIEISQTINMKKVWKRDRQPDKRDVKTTCPNCGDIVHPLLISMTVELEHTRTKRNDPYKFKRDYTIYGVKCKKCDKMYKFKLICYSFHYPKLGQY